MIPRSQHDKRGLQMKIVPRTIHLGEGSHPEKYPEMGFVRSFVVAETGVSIRSEYGFVHPRVRDDTGRNLTEPLSHGVYETSGRGHDMSLEVALVGIEPCLAVVLGEFFVKLYAFSWESSES